MSDDLSDDNSAADAPKPEGKANGHAHDQANGREYNDAVGFLRAFNASGLWALTAISPDGVEKIEGRSFYPADDAALREWIAARNGKKNIYFHSNLLRQGFRGRKAARKDIEQVGHLHVDIDPQEGKPRDDERERIRHLLTDGLPPGVPRPTWIIDSGNGYQAFWRLEQPFEVGGDENKAAEIERYNRQLAALLGGDKCHSIDHLMRLPGTINVPDARKLKKGRVPVPAGIVEDNGVAYPLSEFTPAPLNAANGATDDRHDDGEAERVELTDLDKWSVSHRVKIIIEQGCDPDEPKKGDNSRSAWLFDVVCNLVRCKVPDSTILSVITDARFRISDSVLEKPNPARYALHQIEQSRRRIAEHEDPVLKELNEKHAVICDYGDRVRVMTERPGQTPQFQSIDDFKNRYLNEPAPAGRRVTRAKWWLKHPRCRKYERAEFLPGKETEPDVLNLWRGSPVTPREGNCSKLLALVRDVICAGNTEHADWILSWMAHAVQRPYEPGEVAVALRGGQGIGKSFFAERLGELFGRRHFVAVTDPKHVVGNFNAILQEALLVFADEAFAANDKRAEGVLKGLVTKSDIVIEPKGVDAFIVPKFLRLILASNHSWVVPADLDDRRFLVLDVSEAHKNDHVYFRDVHTEWASGGREALMHFLANRDISDFDHRARPETMALADQKLHSLRGARRVVLEMLTSGAASALKTEGASVFVATREVLDRHQANCSEKSLASELARLARNRQSERETCDGKQRRGFWLPSLAETRIKWAAAAGVSPRWPDDDGHWETVEGQEPAL